MTKRVVVTGRGLVTPLGNGLAQNVQSLMDGKTGTVFMPEWREMGLESQGCRSFRQRGAVSDVQCEKSAFHVSEFPYGGSRGL